MNKKYEVPVKIVFEGTVLVNAETKLKARHLVKKNVDAILGRVDCNGLSNLKQNIGMRSTQTLTGIISLSEDD